MLSKPGQYVAFTCEGSAEQFVLNTLIERNELSIPRSMIIPNANGKWFFTRKEAISQLTSLLEVDYGDHPLLMIRIVDSDSDTLKIPRGYEHQIEVRNLHTHPEIEMLVIIHEGKYSKYTNGSKRIMPSEYCKTELHYKSVKSYSWLERYWSAPGDLEHAIREYGRLHRFRKNEDHGLLELIEL